MSSQAMVKKLTRAGICSHSVALLVNLCLAVGCNSGSNIAANPVPSNVTDQTASVNTASPPTAAQNQNRPTKSWPVTGTHGTHGMVSSDAALASQVGADVLAKGGNAIDAAVATAFALAVVFPEAGNIGGGGFMVIHAADGKNYALDFREVGPKAAQRDMYMIKAAKGRAEPDSRTGALAAGVPGSVAGLWAAHERLGKLPWVDLLAPSIALAEKGFPVSTEFARMVNENKGLELFAETKKVFRSGQLVAGQTWSNPDLASALKRIATGQAKGFYHGKTAELIVRTMKRHGGIITLADLHQYQPKWREPIAVDYRGHTLLTMPLPSSGGLVIAYLAKFLQPFDVGKMAFGSTAHIHLLAEAFRRGFAYRNRDLGDPDGKPISTDIFLHGSQADKDRGGFSATRATPSAEFMPDAPAVVEPMHTTHISVVDGVGNAVAMTTTINTNYGSKLVVDGAGFLLNNEMDDFTTQVGRPNVFGLIQGENNAVGPGKRMLSSMTPTIVLDGQKQIKMVAGAAGGPTIITATFQIISNVLDFGMSATEACAAPRIHHQHLPDEIRFETGYLSTESVNELQQMGHTLKQTSFIADGPSIVRDSSGWLGSPEPRQDGSLAAGQ